MYPLIDAFDRIRPEWSEYVFDVLQDCLDAFSCCLNNDNDVSVDDESKQIRSSDCPTKKEQFPTRISSTFSFNGLDLV